ncbi:MAG TPA: competence/damage-inducible protein A, partial [Pirellulales bacterium]|nr:competence/damage-inducible protein A [Pirellulales bacterium]
MIAEVISIGDELTSGQRLDTNSQWLSQRLGEIGVPVLYHTTVADDLEANVRVFRQAVERADVVIATGGLGPTADDLTREALAQLIGAELVLDDASLAHIRALFSRRKREMPERNLVQAMFPAGARVVFNPHGTAPGIDLEVPPPLGRPSRIFALPGVPAEMIEMWDETVAGRLSVQ